jgi:hypothetical protein
MASKTTGGKGSKKDGVGGGLACAHCQKTGELDTMKRCGRCRRVCYCSVECQRRHWGKGGHKKVCAKEGSSGDRSDGVPGASGGVDTPLKHPCPICLDSEDDAGEAFICTSCGQMFCGSCRKSLAQRGLRDCPTCRAELPDLGAPAKETVRQLRRLLARPAGRHTPIAQLSLGGCYVDGSGVARDEAEAARLFRLAADQGLPIAQYNLGVCYENGGGVAQNSAEAARWYRLAADQGHASAQFHTGVGYQNGIGVAQDSAEAARWFRLAADQGHARAQYNIGVSYQNGTGLPQNSAEAARWFRLSAAQGNALAVAAVAQLGL